MSNPEESETNTGNVIKPTTRGPKNNIDIEMSTYEFTVSVSSFPSNNPYINESNCESVIKPSTKGLEKDDTNNDCVIKPSTKGFEKDKNIESSTYTPTETGRFPPTSYSEEIETNIENVIKPSTKVPENDNYIDSSTNEPNESGSSPLTIYSEKSETNIENVIKPSTKVPENDNYIKSSTHKPTETGSSPPTSNPEKTVTNSSNVDKPSTAGSENDIESPTHVPTVTSSSSPTTNQEESVTNTDSVKPSTTSPGNDINIERSTNEPNETGSSPPTIYPEESETNIENVIKPSTKVPENDNYIDSSTNEPKVSGSSPPTIYPEESETNIENVIKPSTKVNDNYVESSTHEPTETGSSPPTIYPEESETNIENVIKPSTKVPENDNYIDSSTNEPKESGSSPPTIYPEESETNIENVIKPSTKVPENDNYIKSSTHEPTETGSSPPTSNPEETVTNASNVDKPSTTGSENDIESPTHVPTVTGSSSATTNKEENVTNTDSVKPSTTSPENDINIESSTNEPNESGSSPLTIYPEESEANIENVIKPSTKVPENDNYIDSSTNEPKESGSSPPTIYPEESETNIENVIKPSTKVPENDNYIKSSTHEPTETGSSPPTSNPEETVTNASNVDKPSTTGSENDIESPTHVPTVTGSSSATTNKEENVTNTDSVKPSTTSPENDINIESSTNEPNESGSSPLTIYPEESEANIENVIKPSTKVPENDNYIESSSNEPKESGSSPPTIYPEESETNIGNVIKPSTKFPENDNYIESSTNEPNETGSSPPTIYREENETNIENVIKPSTKVPENDNYIDSSANETKESGSSSSTIYPEEGETNIENVIKPSTKVPENDNYIKSSTHEPTETGRSPPTSNPEETVTNTSNVDKPSTAGSENEIESPTHVPTVTGSSSATTNPEESVTNTDSVKPSTTSPGNDINIESSTYASTITGSSPLSTNPEKIASNIDSVNDSYTDSPENVGNIIPEALDINIDRIGCNCNISKCGCCFRVQSQKYDWNKAGCLLFSFNISSYRFDIRAVYNQKVVLNKLYQIVFIPDDIDNKGDNETNDHNGKTPSSTINDSGTIQDATQSPKNNKQQENNTTANPTKISDELLPIVGGIEINKIGCNCKMPRCGCCFRVQLSKYGWNKSACLLFTYDISLNRIDIQGVYNKEVVFHKLYQIVYISDSKTNSTTNGTNNEAILEITEKPKKLNETNDNQLKSNADTVPPDALDIKINKVGCNCKIPRCGCCIKVQSSKNGWDKSACLLFTYDISLNRFDIQGVYNKEVVFHKLYQIVYRADSKNNSTTNDVVPESTEKPGDKKRKLNETNDNQLKSNADTVPPDAPDIKINKVGCNCKIPRCGCCFKVQLSKIGWDKSGCLLFTYDISLNRFDIQGVYNKEVVFHKLYQIVYRSDDISNTTTNGTNNDAVPEITEKLEDKEQKPNDTNVNQSKPNVDTLPPDALDIKINKVGCTCKKSRCGCCFKVQLFKYKWDTSGCLIFSFNLSSYRFDVQGVYNKEAVFHKAYQIIVRTDDNDNNQNFANMLEEIDDSRPINNNKRNKAIIENKSIAKRIIVPSEKNNNSGKLREANQLVNINEQQSKIAEDVQSIPNIDALDIKINSIGCTCKKSRLCGCCFSVQSFKYKWDKSGCLLFSFNVSSYRFDVKAVYNKQIVFHTVYRINQPSTENELNNRETIQSIPNIDASQPDALDIKINSIGCTCEKSTLCGCCFRVQSFKYKWDKLGCLLFSFNISSFRFDVKAVYSKEVVFHTFYRIIRPDDDNGNETNKNNEHNVHGVINSTDQVNQPSTKIELNNNEADQSTSNIDTFPPVALDTKINNIGCTCKKRRCGCCFRVQLIQHGWNKSGCLIFSFNISSSRFDIQGVYNNEVVLHIVYQFVFRSFDSNGNETSKDNGNNVQGIMNSTKEVNQQSTENELNNNEADQSTPNIDTLPPDALDIKIHNIGCTCKKARCGCCFRIQLIQHGWDNSGCLIFSFIISSYSFDIQGIYNKKVVLHKVYKIINHPNDNENYTSLLLDEINQSYRNSKMKDNKKNTENRSNIKALIDIYYSHDRNNNNTQEVPKIRSESLKTNPAVALGIDINKIGCSCSIIKCECCFWISLSLVGWKTSGCIVLTFDFSFFHFDIQGVFNKEVIFHKVFQIVTVTSTKRVVLSEHAAIKVKKPLRFCIPLTIPFISVRLKVCLAITRIALEDTRFNFCMSSKFSIMQYIVKTYNFKCLYLYSPIKRFKFSNNRDSKKKT